MEFDKTLNEKNKLLCIIDGYKFDFRKVLSMIKFKYRVSSYVDAPLT